MAVSILPLQDGSEGSSFISRTAWRSRTFLTQHHPPLRRSRSQRSLAAHARLVQQVPEGKWERVMAKDFAVFEQRLARGSSRPCCGRDISNRNIARSGSMRCGAKKAAPVFLPA